MGNSFPIPGMRDISLIPGPPIPGMKEKIFHPQPSTASPWNTSNGSLIYYAVENSNSVLHVASAWALIEDEAHAAPPAPPPQVWGQGATFRSREKKRSAPLPGMGDGGGMEEESPIPSSPIPPLSHPPEKKLCKKPWNWY